MSGVGAIQNVQMIDKGSVCVTYSSAEESSAAVQTFNQTIIPGNSRYIDVFPMRPGIPMGGMGTTSANASKLNGAALEAGAVAWLENALCLCGALIMEPRTSRSQATCQVLVQL